MIDLYNKCDELLKTLYKEEKFEECFNEFYKIATETHYPLAECMVGYFLMNGIGTTMNPDNAFTWTELAAHHGDIDAMYYLGYMYENGFGTSRDIVEAIKWFKKAAKYGQAEAKEKCIVYRQEFDEDNQEDEIAKYMYD